MPLLAFRYIFNATIFLCLNELEFIGNSDFSFISALFPRATIREKTLKLDLSNDFGKNSISNPSGIEFDEYKNLSLKSVLYSSRLSGFIIPKSISLGDSIFKSVKLPPIRTVR